MRYTIFADRYDRSENYAANFRQGDLDDACGVYCLFTCFNLLDYFDACEEDLAALDRRTRMGRFVRQFDEHLSLFQGGLDVADMRTMLHELSREIETDACEKTGKAVLKFTVEHILRGHPVILGLKRQVVSHWVTAAGLEYVVDDEKAARPVIPDPERHKPERLLLLDPSADAAPFCLWNSSLLVEAQSKGRYPYLWDDENVGLEHALAVWRRE